MGKSRMTTQAELLLPKITPLLLSIFLHSLSLLPQIIGGGGGSSSQMTSCSRGPTKPTTPLLSFLVRLQSEALRTLGPTGFDPKLYVDLPLKRPLSSTQSAFDGLQRVNGSIPVSDLDGFIKEYFGEAGSDLIADDPTDFVPEPDGFLPKVENPQVRAWALGVHSIWKNLSSRVSDDVMADPNLHTLLPLPAPAVVPGSRFREVYYWDSYWVIR